MDTDTPRATQSTPTKAPSPTKRTKRTPVSREEGERRLVEATIELARDQPFGELSAREIARRADMNHGYVHVWFGSKAGLIDAALDRLGTSLVAEFAGGTLSVGVVVHPDVVVMFRLLARLQHEPGGIELAHRRRRPLSELIALQLQQRAGLSAEDASVVAMLSVAAAAGVTTVGSVLDFDVDTMVGAWTRIIAMFAQQ